MKRTERNPGLRAVFWIGGIYLLLVLGFFCALLEVTR